eukprot:5443934-Prymnesium_polylepis.1
MAYAIPVPRVERTSKSHSTVHDMRHRSFYQYQIWGYLSPLGPGFRLWGAATTAPSPPRDQPFTRRDTRRINCVANSVFVARNTHGECSGSVP